jgi:hypothetical protein
MGEFDMNTYEVRLTGDAIVRVSADYAELISTYPLLRFVIVPKERDINTNPITVVAEFNFDNILGYKNLSIRE